MSASMYPAILSLHWTSGPDDETHSHDDLSWESAWAALEAAYESHESLCYCIEWTEGAGSRICFQWMDRSIWQAHGGMGVGRLRMFCETFS